MFTKYCNDVVAADIVLAVMNIARGVNSDGELAAMAFGECASRGTSGAAAMLRPAPLAISLMVFRPTIHPSASKPSYLFS